MKKNSIIRTIYLYVFACLGLVLLTIGSVGFLNMGLKAFVFTKAEDDQKIYRVQPSVKELNGEEPAKIIEVDYVASRRHKDASMNLALMLIGLPLYLYHWTIIKRESQS